MPTKRRLLKGAKFSASHTTVVPDAVYVIQFAGELKSVTKVSPHLIIPKGSRHPRLKFHPRSGGLECIVHGRDAGQHLWIYTNDPVQVQQDIQAAWKIYIT
ncbi:MAG: hypothetical protein ABIO72_02835 [Patescibacteria group bacterium]